MTHYCMIASVPCLVPGVQHTARRCGITPDASAGIFEGTLHRTCESCWTISGILVGIVDRDDPSAQDMHSQRPGATCSSAREQWMPAVTCSHGLEVWFEVR